MDKRTDCNAIVENELKRFSNIVENANQSYKELVENVEEFSLASWNPSTDLLEVKLSPYDFVNTYDLIRTDNQFLNKAVSVLLAVCQEMLDLSDDAKSNFYIPLTMYNYKNGENSVVVVTSQERFSQMLPLLDRVCCFVQQVEQVAWNVIQQLNSLYSNDRNESDVHAGNAHFQVVFEYLGKMLSTLIVLDEILRNNSKLKKDLHLYKILIHSSLSEPKYSDANVKELTSLESVIKHIEATLMLKSILQIALGNLTKKCSVIVSKNLVLQEEMQTVILGWSNQVENSVSDEISSDCQRNILSLTALAICHQLIFASHDRKIVKELLSLFKKVPCVTVCVGIVWLGEKYIQSHFPMFSAHFDHKGSESILVRRKTYLATKTQSISSDVTVANLKVLGWSVEMGEASQRPLSKLNRHHLSRRSSLLLQGLGMAEKLNYLAESILGLHTVNDQPMSKSCVISICHLLEILKAIEHTYCKSTSMLIETLPHLRQYFSFQILTLINGIKIRIKQERKLIAHYLDVLAGLSLAEQALSGSVTNQRRLLARISLSLATQNNLINADDMSSLLHLLKRLELVNDIQSKVKVATNAEFVFLHRRVIFNLYLQDYFENFSSCPHRIHYMLAAIADSEAMLKRPVCFPNGDELVKNFKMEIEEQLKSQFLDKMCKAVEIELRLNTHKHLQLDDRNPFDKPLRLLHQLTQLQPLNVLGSFYSVKEYVEHYLDKTFYSLSVLAPHNCSTYERMRGSALSGLGLVTVPSYLPSHTLEQGVDVLEIMRNIDSFVQNYQYNLNQQFFVEIESSNKHLNTVSIKHIANSIKKHGTGITNTTINFTYQFLKKKLHILSKFLYDEQVKSRLFKDLQYWKELKVTEKSFPFARAEKFCTGIKKLRLMSDGLSYLDYCRKLVTHIGNATGYIRLVRSGALHFVSTATQFVPDPQKVVSFSDFCIEEPLSAETQEAARNLDVVLGNLTSYFQQETDYFKIIVDVFAALREPQNGHMKNFYLLVPPLTINFVEYFLASRGNLTKKSGGSGALFTDDGFAMGLAYILTILDQHMAFDSLHWGSGVRRKFISEKEQIEEECERKRGGDPKLRQTLALTRSRLNQQQREFELLFLGLSSASVLFKGSQSQGLSES